MERLTAIGGLILCATGGLVANKVRPSTTEASGAYGFMGIYHDMVLGSLLDAVEIVVYHPLTVMELTTRDDFTHIAALHSRIAVFVH